MSAYHPSADMLRAGVNALLSAISGQSPGTYGLPGSALGGWLKLGADVVRLWEGIRYRIVELVADRAS